MANDAAGGPSPVPRCKLEKSTKHQAWNKVVDKTTLNTIQMNHETLLKWAPIEIWTKILRELVGASMVHIQLDTNKNKWINCVCVGQCSEDTAHRLFHANKWEAYIKNSTAPRGDLRLYENRHSQCLRNLWNYDHSNDGLNNRFPRIHVAVLGVCHEFYQIANPILWSENIWSVHDAPQGRGLLKYSHIGGFDKFYDRRNAEQKRLIRRVHFGTDVLSMGYNVKIKFAPSVEWDRVYIDISTSGHANVRSTFDFSRVKQYLPSREFRVICSGTKIFPHGGRYDRHCLYPDGRVIEEDKSHNICVHERRLRATVFETQMETMWMVQKAKNQIELSKQADYRAAKRIAEENAKMDEENRMKFLKRKRDDDDNGSEMYDRGGDRLLVMGNSGSVSFVGCWIMGITYGA